MKVDDQTYFVSEIFESIQGEGNFTGINSLFIRFQLCNLTCTWCDTKYTWTKFSGESTLHELEALKTKIAESSKSHVIFTGGEPALYRLDLLAGEHKKYHVETNGTIIPTETCKMKLRDGSEIDRSGMDENIIRQFNWVVSPKLSNAKQDAEFHELAFWITRSYAVFKFIVENEKDLDELDELIQKYNIPHDKVYTGIQGVSIKSQLNKNLVEKIIQRNYHFSPRLHILFWGQERGK